MVIIGKLSKENKYANLNNSKLMLKQGVSYITKYICKEKK